MMHWAAAAMGAILLLIALVGFFRSLWRSPPKRQRDEQSPDGLPGGALGAGSLSSTDHANGGGHAGH
jgi:hypothetical protein